MKLDYWYLLFAGYVVYLSDLGQSKHVKIYLPVLVHKHKHVHTVYKKPHTPKKTIVIHKHVHQHGHGHKHGHNHKAKHDHHHKHGHNHKHDHKNKHKHDHKHHVYKHHHDKHKYQDYDHGPIDYKDSEYELLQRTPEFDDDYRTTKKLLKTEHYEVEHIDNAAEDPVDRVKISGSYKVQESDPSDITTMTSYRAYDSPFTKEIAKKLTNFPEASENDYISNSENYDTDEDHTYENYVLHPGERIDNSGK